MERVLTILTEKEQALVRTILFAGMPTFGAGLRGRVGIHLDSHTSMQERFISDHTVQLCKGPFGKGTIGFALFGTGLLAFPSFGLLANICQMLQSNQALRIVGNNPFTHDMIGVCFQPSLSSTDGNEPSRCRTSAFFLQTLSQSCRVV